ncbi:SRPBCC family protein [Nocardia alba]|uniref:Polyketide cyclase/dehydrase/lipid transport protein n=1 Tax=Nocardia alba TaxID=225051 RepID=A0A4R1G7N0_9NOCA|nr:SRPBCC family protein [Nocardia alba]TCJ99921.1 polyketide cyclase/dehydrase/lipid transport protein [Nocardia alba]
MLTAEVTVPVRPERAFATLADGWLYASWVVGASHIGEVDPGWPAVGSRIHYRFGLWPVLISDTTVVRAIDPPHRLELEARLWSVGSAWISFTLAEKSAGHTTIRMVERAVRGPAQLIPGPAQDLIFSVRNQESLDRLAAVIRARSQND